MSMPVLALALAFVLVLVIAAVVLVLLALRRRSSGYGSGPLAGQPGSRELGESLDQRYPAQPGAGRESAPIEPETYR